MARGGYRPGAGRPKGAGKNRQDNKAIAAEARKSVSVAIAEGGAPDPSSPLGYMLGVMNDAAADEVRRDRMAVAAAPFVHPRVADNRVGKRDVERGVAAQAGKSGRFVTPATPLKLVANNSQ